jgi:hypothetical protein
MTEVRRLRELMLEPVVELEPTRFATRTRSSPDASGEEAPAEWDQYWRASLADASIVGLTPVRPGSWHVPTRQLTDAVVTEKVVRGVIEGWGEYAALVGPDADPVLDGGLVLFAEQRVILEPACCGDLRNVADWRAAAAHRGSDWQTLWIGHPWVSVRFDEGRLLLSDPHEADEPLAAYALDPNEFMRAVEGAAAELELFSQWLVAAVAPIVGDALAPALGRQLAGLMRR